MMIIRATVSRYQEDVLCRASAGRLKPYLEPQYGWKAAVRNTSLLGWRGGKSKKQLADKSPV